MATNKPAVTKPVAKSAPVKADQAKPTPAKTVSTKPASVKSTVAKPVISKTVNASNIDKAKPIATTKIPTKSHSASQPSVLKKEKVAPLASVARKKSKGSLTEKPAIAKTKKSKLIRDSFTIPEHEYKLIQALKERAATQAVPLKKSELLRAGILWLYQLPNAEFLKAISTVDIIKTGRPAKTK